MLRRYDQSDRGIGEALRELTIEHERLLAEGHRATREKLDDHLKAAGELLASGKVSEAWAHACDALQLDPADKKAIALEARIRKALEAQAARDLAREQEQTRLAHEARAREIERTNALARSRMAIENSLVIGQDLRREQSIEQVVRREQSSPSSQPQAVASVIGQPRVLWAAAAVPVVAAAALWLVPLAMNSPPQSTTRPAAAPPTDVTRRTASPPSASVAPAPVSAPAATAAAPGGTDAASAETAAPPGPAAAAPDIPTAPRETAVNPTATTGTASSAPAAVPNETIVANFLKHVQTLLAKKDPELALSVLTDALAYAPADKGLRAMGPKILEQAQTRARQERSKALAKGASGRPKFKQADRTDAAGRRFLPRTKHHGVGRRVSRSSRPVRQLRDGARRGRCLSCRQTTRRSPKPLPSPSPSLLPWPRR